MLDLTIQDIPYLGYYIKQWWWRNTTPGYYGIPRTDGAMHIVRSHRPEANVMFDLNGNCIGDEDYILGEWCFHPIDSDMEYRMPLIALWRTKRRKPVGMR